MAEEVILTKEGLEELEKRLEYLKVQKRARSPSASRSRASSATFPKTPNTTRPKTNRR